MTGLKSTRVVMDVRKRKGREMDERKPHKWSEVIKAWADGKPIQFKVGESEWIDWIPDQLRQSNASAIFFPFDVPRFDLFEWRVKPDYFIIERCLQSPYGQGTVHFDYKSAPNIRFIFNAGKLVKAEVIG